MGYFCAILLVLQLVNTSSSRDIKLNFWNAKRGIDNVQSPSYTVPKLNGPEWTPYRRTGLDTNYPKLNDFEKPTWINTYSIKSINIPKLNTTTITTVRVPSARLAKEILWVILAPFIAIAMIIRCIVRKCCGKNNTRSINDAHALPHSNVYLEVPTNDVSSTLQPNNSTKDSPPTYDDIVNKGPITTTMLVKSATS